MLNLLGREEVRGKVDLNLLMTFPFLTKLAGCVFCPKLDLPGLIVWSFSWCPKVYGSQKGTDMALVLYEKSMAMYALNSSLPMIRLMVPTPTGAPDMWRLAVRGSDSLYLRFAWVA